MDSQEQHNTSYSDDTPPNIHRGKFLVKIITISAVVLVLFSIFFVNFYFFSKKETGSKISSEESNVSYSQKLLAFDTNNEFWEVILSPDTKKFAAIVEYYGNNNAYGQYVLSSDGKGKLYDEIYNLTFSESGETLVYTAIKDNKWFAVVNGVEGTKYDKIDWLILSPDGQKVAYVAQRAQSFEEFVEFACEGDQSCIQESQSPESKKMIQDSISKSHLSYMVINNKEIGPFSRLSNPTFSADSQTVAFAAVEADDYSYPQKLGIFHNDVFVKEINEAIEAGSINMVYDFNTGKYQFVDSGIVSPDGKKFAYSPVGSYHKKVLLDDKERGTSQDLPGGYDLVFSSDSTKLAYWFNIEDHTQKEVIEYGHIILNGVPQKNYVNVGSPVFSPDSKNVAYFATVKSEESKEKSTVLVVNDKEIKIDANRYGDVSKGEIVSDPYFSPDGKYIVFLVLQNESELWLERIAIQ